MHTVQHWLSFIGIKAKVYNHRKRHTLWTCYPHKYASKFYDCQGLMLVERVVGKDYWLALDYCTAWICAVVKDLMVRGFLVSSPCYCKLMYCVVLFTATCMGCTRHSKEFILQYWCCVYFTGDHRLFDTIESSSRNPSSEGFGRLDLIPEVLKTIKSILSTIWVIAN